MAGVIPRFEHGPVTYKVAETIAGGQCVEARASGLVGVAAAGSLVFLGVATRDGKVATSPEGTTADGFPVIDISHVGDHIAVGKTGEWPVTYALAANFGVALICAANGQVTPAGATPDARTVIGYCAEPGGVAQGAVGLMRITRS